MSINLIIVKVWEKRILGIKIMNVQLSSIWRKIELLIWSHVYELLLSVYTPLGPQEWTEITQ